LPYVFGKVSKHGIYGLGGIARELRKDFSGSPLGFAVLARILHTGKR
jgi:hypothetical protein